MNLNAWKNGHLLILNVYEVSKSFPREEQFGLTNQIRRASVSVTSNIAEGFSRGSYKEKAQFYSMALGSLTEVQNQLKIALDLGYIVLNRHEELQELIITISKLLNGLIKKSKTIIHNL